MKCKKNNGKKCLLWPINHLFGLLCFKDKETDKYVISCSEERELKKAGKKDGENDLLKYKDINGESYCYTGNILKLMKKFENIVGEEYEKQYINNLTNLNTEIAKYMQDGENEKENSCRAVWNKKAAIEDASAKRDTALINIRNSDIFDITQNCYNKITSINTMGKNAEEQANSTLDKYNTYFQRELTLWLEKIHIYWNSFCAIGLKMYESKYKNISLPNKDILMAISDVRNPSEGFQVKKYIDILKPENWSKEVE